MLNSDSKIFDMLDEELHSLDELRQNEEEKIIQEVKVLAKKLKASDPNNQNCTNGESYSECILIQKYISNTMIPNYDHNKETVNKLNKI